MRGQSPDAREKILIAAETRRLIGGIKTTRPAGSAVARIAEGRNETDARLAQDVLLESKHAHGTGGGIVAILARDPRMHDECAVIGAVRATADFCANLNRHLGPIQQSDPPTEEGFDVIAEAESEIENVRALEKKRALLREEERKSRQVGAPRVDFGLGEVGVDGERGERVRTQRLRDVQTGIAGPCECGLWRRHAASR